MDYTINAITQTLVFLGFISGSFFAFYFYLKLRNRERMALIEKGVDIREIYKRNDSSFKFPWFRIGMLFMGIGLGLIAYLIFIASPVSQSKSLNQEEVANLFLTFSVLFFGGLFIVIGNILERIWKKKNG